MPQDRWSAWFAERSHGGDERTLAGVLDASASVRDGVLARAGIEPGDVVLDIGCADGLIGFAALDRVGARGGVIFDDISDELLDRCRERADGDERCRFVNGSVTELPLRDGEIDVVTGAAVLIYVPEKQRAFDELHRVLRPGGRVSLFEPLNSFGYPEPAETFYGIEVGAMRALTERVRDVWRAIELPEYDAMHNWNERDLLVWAERAGFSEIEYEASYLVAPADPSRITRAARGAPATRSSRASQKRSSRRSRPRRPNDSSSGSAPHGSGRGRAAFGSRLPHRRKMGF